MSRFRRAYGNSPVHLLASLATLALVALALLTWLRPGSPSSSLTIASSPHASAMGSMDMSATTTPTRSPAASGRCTASICPIPSPGPDELSVADQLGSALAAVWITPAGHGMSGRLELLNANMGPIVVPARIAGTSSLKTCGPACWTFTLPDQPATLGISARERGRRYSVRLPIRWERGQSGLARELVKRAVASMGSLRGVRDYETMTAGPPTPVEKFHYRLSAPDRMAYTMSEGGRVTTIGHTEWSFTPGQGWQRSIYGGGTFTTRSWYDWNEYDQSVQLLGQDDVDGRRTAEVALMSPGLPVWFRLRIVLPRMLVSSVRMIAGGHFMSEDYSDYGSIQRIIPPTR